MASSGGKLSELQMRVLDVLSAMEPRFVLSGGGALAGFHLGNRTTRDLDLFWRGQEQLGNLPRVVEGRLVESGLSVSTLQSSPAFVRLRVTDSRSAVLVDLIAESTDAAEPPAPHRVGRAEILVDSAPAILVDKLCALLERSELRDLIDVQALVQSGEDLSLAIARAPERDSGFSPLTLAWVLRDFDVRKMALSLGLDDTATEHLDTFKLILIDRLVASAER